MQTLNRFVVSNYVIAIVNLWSFQKSSNVNFHLNSRDEALNVVIRTHNQQKHVRKRKQFANQVIDILTNDYDEVEKNHVVRCC
jgi:hypothetical protein